MASIDISKEIVKYKRSYVNTDKGRQYIFRLDDKDREKILRNIKTDWRELIRLHFAAEGGITRTGKVYSWKALNPQYVQFKERNNLEGGILEAHEPSLMIRYQKGIKYRIKDARIWINYPQLITGPTRVPVLPTSSPPDPDIDAGVHQMGQVRRRIVKSSFTEAARRRFVEHYTK